MNATSLTMLVCSLCTVASSFGANSCAVKSGPSPAALVELYTSEGCSSCPPADQQLSKLQQQVDATTVVVPLALHVSYWNQIGWKDVFAQKTFDARQSELLAKKQERVVYSPQFFVNGAELRSWNNNLPAAIRQINAKPAPLTIALKSTPLASDSVLLEAEVKPNDEATKTAKFTNGALYVAISESGLVSHVLRGENSGATLHHDATARLWIGPMQLSNGTTHFRKEIKFPDEWNRQHLQAVAFVQDQHDGTVLQAVNTQQCGLTGGL